MRTDTCVERINSHPQSTDHGCLVVYCLLEKERSFVANMLCVCVSAPVLNRFKKHATAVLSKVAAGCSHEVRSALESAGYRPMVAGHA